MKFATSTTRRQAGPHGDARDCGANAEQLSMEAFMPTIKIMTMTAILLSVAACGDTWGQRAVTGGAIGAGSGAVIGGVTGVGVLPGAVIGGVVGAGVGAATTPSTD
jgi:osmotically inducible lipoprotein OsmB